MREFGTELTHLGNTINLGEQAIPKVAPIVLSGAYAFRTPEDLEAANRHEITGYSYGRDGSVTNDCAREILTALEGGEISELFPSGMAAIGCTLMSLLQTGDHVIMNSIVFGTTYNMLVWQLAKRYGVEVDVVDMLRDDVEQYFKPNTKAIFFESISNPLAEVIDIRDICAKAHRHNVKVVVDNTFATPIVCRPLDLGADVVVYSATKFMNGHSDIISGVVVIKDKSKVNFKAIADMRRIFGACVSPLEAFLLTRGLRTLELRMHAHCKNAIALAQFLSEEKKIPVCYSGLKTSKYHKLARSQFNEGLYGGMLSIDLGSYETVMNVARNLKMVQLVVSLGCLTTTICDTRTTHSSMSAEERKKSNIGDGILRISVGIERTEDIIRDFDQALTTVGIK